MKDIVILGGARTPIGSFQGTLSSIAAPKLGSIAIKCALENSGVSADQIEQVIMGNVLQAGGGPAPARQAGVRGRGPGRRRRGRGDKGPPPRPEGGGER